MGSAAVSELTEIARSREMDPVRYFIVLGKIGELFI
jgi:hypothetical protein